MNKIKYFVVGFLVGVASFCILLKKIVAKILLTPVGMDVIIPHLKNMIADSTDYALYGDYKRNSCKHKKWTKQPTYYYSYGKR